MSDDHTELAFSVLRLADRLPEPYCDRFGRESMDLIDARSLASRLGWLMVPVENSDDPGHLQTVLDRPVFFYRAGLDAYALTHLVLEWVARGLDTGCPPAVATAFAFAARMGMEGIERGVGWIRASWTRLRCLSEVWYQALCTALPELLSGVRAALVEINDLAPDHDAISMYWTADRTLLQARLARRRGALARAERWALATVAHATATPSITADALNCLGRCAYQRGRVAAAAAQWRRVVAHAETHGLQHAAGTAHINLVSVGIMMHDEAAIQRHTAAAIRCFPPGHEELGLLAQNYARYRIDLGSYAAALPVLRALSTRPKLSHQARTAVYAGIARCCAGVGDWTGFEHAWYATLTMLELAEEWAPDAHYELAQAAVLLGEWERAERVARKALSAARERGDGRALIQADQVLARIARQEGALRSNGVLEPVPWVPDGEVSLGLAAALVPL
jgi:tetratricopeptide (TPR) repeat protein